MIDFEILKAKLFSLSSKEFSEFSKKLIPNSKPLIGVKIPLLREIVKEFNVNDIPYFIENFSEEYHEYMLLKAISFGKLKSEEIVFKLIDNFIFSINNWCECDVFCASFKFAKKNQEKFFNYLVNLSKLKGEFTQRVVAVMLLDHFINDCYLDKAFNLILKLDCAKYYCDMAIGWFVSVAFVKYPEKTIEFLKSKKLTKVQLKYSVNKICQSQRVDGKEKFKIRELFKDE